jgi:lipopolysaccharide transport protein LptA
MMNDERMIRAFIGVVTLAVFLCPPQVTAAGPEGKLTFFKTWDQAIEITAKKLTIRSIPDGVELIYEGNSKAKSGEMTLTSDRLTAILERKKVKPGQGKRPDKGVEEWQDTGEPRSLVATGNVKYTQKDLEATCGKAVFDKAEGTITLTEGPPRVRFRGNEAKAEKIVIYPDENRVEAVGKDENGVRAIIHPDKGKKEKEK